MGHIKVTVPSRLVDCTIWTFTATVFSHACATLRILKYLDLKGDADRASK